MPIANYGVLACKALEGKYGPNTNDHYQVRVSDGSLTFRIAINAKSQQQPSDLLYYADEAFEHPVLSLLETLSLGFQVLPNHAGGIALDYIRDNLFDASKMRIVAETAPAPFDSLYTLIDAFIQRAITEKDAVLYAFGQRWPEGGTDQYFNFSPDNGIHDIHMNQGNSGTFTKDDGVWQDGGLIIHYPIENRWTAIFLAFQSQCFHTDDTTGHCLQNVPTPPPTTKPAVRIVAALVNPAGADTGHETVTLLNAGQATIDLTGWQIADSRKQKDTISGALLDPNHTITIRLRGNGAQLSNNGGIITLLDPHGVKIDGVAYTKAQAQASGRVLSF